jgi:YfiR/HmsC-like
MQMQRRHLSQRELASSRNAGAVSGLRTVRILCIPLVLSAAVACWPAFAQSQADEYRVKAAFLYHFAQLIEWPADPPGDPANSFLMCTLGQDPFRGELETTIGGKSIGKRAITIKHFKQPEGISNCQILFISRAEEPHLQAIFNALARDPVLTVGEAEDFVQQGGTIRFFLEDNKIRFDINLEAANHSGLQVSSRLLLLAKTVIRKGRGD